MDLLYQQGNLRASQNNRLGTVSLQFVDDVQVKGAGFITYRAQTEFLVDHVVHQSLIGLVRNQNLDTELVTEPVLVKILLHGESCSQQAHGVDTVIEQLLRGGIGSRSLSVCFSVCFYPSPFGCLLCVCVSLSLYVYVSKYVFLSFSLWMSLVCVCLSLSVCICI